MIPTLVLTRSGSKGRFIVEASQPYPWLPIATIHYNYNDSMLAINARQLSKIAGNGHIFWIIITERYPIRTMESMDNLILVLLSPSGSGFSWLWFALV